jgi:CheY-like chemotaxis protein
MRRGCNSDESLVGYLADDTALYLPTCPPCVPSCVAPMEAPPLPTVLQILVADDDADMRLYLAGCLRGFGWAALTVTEVGNGRDALLLARTLAFDLIISDLVMPGMDGFALCRALKADAATAAVPFLLISGEMRAPPDCANGFLEKPFNAAGLRAHVERLLAPPA